MKDIELMYIVIGVIAIIIALIPVIKFRKDVRALNKEYILEEARIDDLELWLNEPKDTRGEWIVGKGRIVRKCYLKIITLHMKNFGTLEIL